MTLIFCAVDSTVIDWFARLAVVVAVVAWVVGAAVVVGAVVVGATVVVGGVVAMVVVATVVVAVVVGVVVVAADAQELRIRALMSKMAIATFFMGSSRKQRERWMVLGLHWLGQKQQFDIIYHSFEIYTLKC